jgi:Ca-activated chloride channel homolog
MMRWIDSYQFAWPWVLSALALLPLLALWSGRRGATAAIQFPTAFLFAGMAVEKRSRFGALWISLALLALGCGIIALARPQEILASEEEQSEGVSICLAVDVSLSMGDDDFVIGGIRSTRISAAKRVMRDFISQRKNDRIGIVAFAGAPYFPCPLTLDHDWLLQNLDRVELGVTVDGTAIGSGIATAARRLDLDKKAKSKIIILITDGANNSGRLSPQDAASLAATLGIRIYCVSIGTEGVHTYRVGGRIINSGRQEFDEPTLKKVAEIGNGQFFRVQDTTALEQVFKNIDELEKSNLQRKKKYRTKELYRWPASLAALLLMLGMLWQSTLGSSQPQD